MVEQPSRRHYTVSSLNGSEEERLCQVLDHFAENRAYAVLPAKAKNEVTLANFQAAYRNYRQNWRGLPEKIISEARQDGEVELLYPPMCVDIEVAAICDLACPFCYRQHIATADGLMKKALFKEIIDQCVGMGVPSIKLNWRGEPLLHPALPEFIDYAKKRGILEVLMNTNGVSLTPEKSEAIIRAGIDVLIYSFDGGTAETYNRMRPGRFKPNSFAEVYANIKRFTEIRNGLGSFFPRTRIQMIVTEETLPEVENFYALFEGVVDDVSTKAYSERGGNLHDFTAATLKRVKAHFRGQGRKNFRIDPASVWRQGTDRIRYATGRLPCQQLFQRMVVTYDGRVHMCCYDWQGARTMGYVSERGFISAEKELQTVLTRALTGRKGFEHCRTLALPVKDYEPEKKVQPLREIWRGNTLSAMRRLHLTGRMNDCPTCRECNFRDTFTWEEIA